LSTPLSVLSPLFSLPDPATTHIYPLSLHDALPIFFDGPFLGSPRYALLNTVIDRIAAKYDVPPPAIATAWITRHPAQMQVVVGTDRKSTRLNSSHVSISYAVFCLKKKKKTRRHDEQ